jgi:Homeodomain-like domain
MDSLKQRLQHEHHGRKTPRIQILYWLASRQAQTRQDVAPLLGVHRNTVTHWLQLMPSPGQKTSVRAEP